jgi:TetR/AcrR family transcriptional regulator, fatty acid metabolism regulator protein
MARTQANDLDEQVELSPRAQALVRSAYRVITRQGSHRLTLQDVADEAGVSKGMVLYYFQTKENLFLTTMRYALERTGDRIRERIAGVADPQQVIAALVDAIFIDPERNRDFFLLYIDLIEHAARVPSFSRLSALSTEIINGLYEEVIRDGVARGGLVVDDPAAAAAAMRAQIDGTFLAWLLEADGKAAHPRYKADCLQSLLRLLGAQVGTGP